MQRRYIRRPVRCNDILEVDCVDEFNMIFFSFTMEHVIYDSDLKKY